MEIHYFIVIGQTELQLYGRIITFFFQEEERASKVVGDI